MTHVTFIHGIANKPECETLVEQWRQALQRDRGLDLDAGGVTSSMVYWADVLYPEPKNLEEGMLEGVDPGELEPDMSWRDELTGDEQAWVDQLEGKMVAQEDSESILEDSESTLEAVPLPWALKRPLMKVLLRDVHHYLFNTEHQADSERPPVNVQDEIRRRFVEGLREGAAKPGAHIVVSHSMGTVIAYDCLKRVEDCPRVDALVTIGSPLGLDDIQAQLQPGWTPEDGFPSDKVEGDWVNVFDRLDLVSFFDPTLSNDYLQGGREVVDDIHEQSSGAWRHDIERYFAGPKLRAKLRSLLGLQPA